MVFLRRSIALLVALLVLLTAGGVMATAAALEPACASSCCPSEEAPANDGSCPEPDCQCTFCLTMEIIPHATRISSLVADLSWDATTVSPLFSDFVRTIEYPPKA